MSFGNWYVLIGLFVPAAMLVWVFRRTAGRIVLPQDYGTQRKGWFWAGLLKTLEAVPPLLLAVAILLLAQPRHLSVPKAERELTNIVFCLDLSGSMIARFGSGTRYDAAMEAINQFVEKRKGDAYGLVVFGDVANQWIPLTTEASAFQCATPFLDPTKNLPPGYGGGTMIGLALKKCQDVLLQQETGDRMIILVSDGVSADLSGGRDELIARSLRDDNIAMYGIHIGGGMTPPEVAAIATITGGATFAPEDTLGLNQVFQRIDGMRQAKLARSFAELLDWFTPFCVAGISLVGLALASLLGLRYTPW
jgi:Ca-activated chloride channel family protein